MRYFVFLFTFFVGFVCMAADPTSGQWLFQKKNSGAGFTNYGLTAENSKAFGLDGSGAPTMITLPTGTVTSVALSVPSFLSVSGSPVTTSGTLVVSLANQNANVVFAGPSTGSAAAPTWRALVAADIPDMSNTYQPLNSGLSAISALTTASYGRGVLETANAAALRTYAGLGTVATLNTGTASGNVPVLGSGGSLALVGSVTVSGVVVSSGSDISFSNNSFLGHITTATLSNSRNWTFLDKTGYVPIVANSGGLVSLASEVTGTLPTANIANSAVTNAKLANVAQNRIKGRVSSGSGEVEDLTGAQVVSVLSGAIPVEIGVACSDETTPITTGAGKVTFRMPYPMTVTAVRASLTDAPTGSAFVADIKEGGVSILSTDLSVDAGETTSATATTPPVISDSSLADDAEITIDFEQVGSTNPGTGVKIWIIGTR